ncbi:hypothetical protein PQR75_40780 [Paraburkholderia fungorum]|uniref:hypothetical protein n=1 Tax=Paraburkholderia fungorum TaxID=134537 RepID=UPI0038B8A65B
MIERLEPLFLHFKIWMKLMEQLDCRHRYLFIQQTLSHPSREWSGQVEGKRLSVTTTVLQGQR